MKRNDYLAKRSDLMTQAQAAIDGGELETADKLTEDIKTLDALWESTTKAQANLKALTLENSGADVPAIAQAPEVMGAATDIDPTDTIEYRKAFAKYVASKGRIKMAVTQNETTKTTDISPVIPANIINRIVEKLETLGVILPLVTRTAYEPGASVPVAGVKPTATWVAEGATSNKQKVPLGSSIVFAGFKLRCEISITLEAATRSLDFFEAYFVSTVSKAMIKAIETAIIAGTGSGQPKGILSETPVTGQAVTTKTTALKYADLVAAESALPLEYEDGAVWVMSKKNFGDVEGLVDEQGQPVARVNYGIGNRAERRILGRPVILCDYIPANGPWGFIYRFEDYIFNTNYAMRVSSREDWDTEDQQTKAVMIADGKAVDINSLVTLSIKSA